MGSGVRAAPVAVARCGGFTLVELLVVMAVIAILAAMVAPVAVNSMKAARATNCQSNLHQIAAAFTSYHSQHGGFMPPTGSPNGKPPRRFPYWYKNLTPLVRDAEIFRCPGKRRAEIGYGINHIWCGPDEIYGEGTAMNNVSKEIGLVRNSSRTLIITDSGKIDNKDDSPRDWMESDASNTGGSCFFPYDNRPDQHGTYTWWYKGKTAPAPRHPGYKTEVMFFDGHVEGIATIDIVDDLWDEPACIYDNDGHPKRKEKS